jgi:import inner membrane translocase subunit TIM10
MIETCYDKCVSEKLIDGNLNVGETVCVDRCVAKFHQVQEIVSEQLKKLQQELAPKQ